MDQTAAAAAVAGGGLREKTEASGLRAGVGAELGLVIAKGDKDNPDHKSKVHGSERSGSIHDLVRAVTSFGVLRKKRMTRHRRSSIINFHDLSSFAGAASSNPSHVLPPPSTLPPARVIDPTRLRFLFQKELKNSDVSSLRRMILPKKAAEAHLPTLESKEGMAINMDDIDGLHVWSFKYRFWPNNNSRMYVLENTGEFVNAHGLQFGDYIMVYQDNHNQNYVIQARKASDQDHVYGDISGMNIAVNDLYMQESSSFYMPKMEEDTTAGLSFVYDTTTYSNDSLLDFFGGSMMTNYSRNGSLHESFGSVENLSLDDFY
ncbi:B3 domain-containing transcription factor FUS3-like [Malus sylvestris]|uniref:B3 domain-containing transcription factor FUS3-like n=1 Tax=Malus sylvestris TaxID=3752 RepID=UPI0021AC2393|nr:B3 domain-containing transcription factor FUS3-like [Malus sylvestris]